MGAGSELAPCTGQLTMNTNWHKTTSLSSVAMSFWTSTASWAGTPEQLLEGFNIVAPVVTGTTGAWPSKVGAISNVTTTFVDTAELEYPYILNIAYKVGEWAPVDWEWGWEWEWAKIIISIITHTPFISTTHTHTGARLEPHLLQVNCRSTGGSRGRHWSKSPCMITLIMHGVRPSSARFRSLTLLREDGS